MLGNQFVGKVIAEFLGTFLLLNAIVGSGIMATQLTEDVALQLAINALSTTLMLFVLISVFQMASGAHFNPIVTLFELIKGRKKLGESIVYVFAQLMGAITGTILANIMFDIGFTNFSSNSRFNLGTFIGEVLATFGLVMIIALQPMRSYLLVPAWIGSAYFFTSSTAFANPAVTVGRAFTNSFAGIEMTSVFPFIAAQALGLLLILYLTNKVFERNR